MPVRGWTAGAGICSRTAGCSALGDPAAGLPSVMSLGRKRKAPLRRRALGRCRPAVACRAGCPGASRSGTSAHGCVPRVCVGQSGCRSVMVAAGGPGRARVSVRRSASGSRYRPAMRRTRSAASAAGIPAEASANHKLAALAGLVLSVASVATSSAAGLVRDGVGLRGLGDGDGVAQQRLDLPDVVLDLLVLVGAGLVVAGAEVGVSCGRLGEQMPVRR